MSFCDHIFFIYLEDLWRRVPESNRCTPICNPLRHHSANSPQSVILLAYDLNRSKQLKINYFLFANGKTFFQAEVISTNSPDIGEVSLQITPILRLGDGLGN